MNTYFQSWIDGPDRILSDLAQRYINRKVLKSITFKAEEEEALDHAVAWSQMSVLTQNTILLFTTTSICRMTFTVRMQKETDSN